MEDCRPCLCLRLHKKIRFSIFNLTRKILPLQSGYVRRFPQFQGLVALKQITEWNNQVLVYDNFCGVCNNDDALHCCLENLHK